MTRHERARRRQISIALRRLWRNPKRRQHMARMIRKKWREKGYRQRMSRSATLMWRRPGFRRALLVKLRASRQRPAYRRRMAQLMTRRWRDPISRAKLLPAVRRNLGPSIGALALHPLLGRDWIVEYWTPAGPIDLAYPRLKLAIEVDGTDHRHPKRQSRDRQKQRRLQRMGWSVFRVSETGCRNLIGGLN